MKLNVHGGHSLKCRGASGLLDEVKEDRLVKNKLIEILKANGHTVYDCTDDVSTTQKKNLSAIVKKCNAHTVDLDISIHLDCGRKDKKGDGKTGGCSVFIYDDSSYKQALAVASAISKTLGIGYHGEPVKIDKNLYVLRNTKAKAMLIECCFVDDKDDYNKWSATKCAMAIATAFGCKTNVSHSTGKNVSRETKYFPICKLNSVSIVACLKSVKAESSYSYREKIAKVNNISNYKGTAPQNDKMVALIKKGKLVKP